MFITANQMQNVNVLLMFINSDCADVRLCNDTGLCFHQSGPSARQTQLWVQGAQVAVAIFFGNLVNTEGSEVHLRRSSKEGGTDRTCVTAYFYLCQSDQLLSLPLNS